jgi:hypothetical protein
MGVEIAGSLSDLEFGQLLTILTAVEREGVLELWNLPSGHHLEMHLKHGLLHCVRRNGRQVGAVHVKPLLQELLQTQQGAFEFHARKVQGGCGPRLGWPLERILLSAHAEYDEQLHHSDDLPDPNQRYALKRGVRLPSHPFLDAARPFFVRKGGASAKELARWLDLPEDRVRYLMLKMLRKDWLEAAGEPPTPTRTSTARPLCNPGSTRRAPQDGALSTRRGPDR